MSKSIEEIFAESVRSHNSSINNELRKRLTQGLYFNEVKELQYIETRIKQTKNNIVYSHGGFALDDDVVSLITSLRKKCVKTLGEKASFYLDCYKKRKELGEPIESIEYLRKKAFDLTVKATSIQKDIDVEEAKKRALILHKAEEEQKKQAKIIKRKKLIGKLKKCIIPFSIILICIIVTYSIANIRFIIPKNIDNNIELFKKEYESNTIPILKKNSLKLKSIEYPELVPDYILDTYEVDRINEYNVYVYIDEEAPSYNLIAEIVSDINWKNCDILLSNTYELLDDCEYVRDDTKETGFHEVNTILIFNDGGKYKKEYITLYKDGIEVWQKESSYTPPETGFTDSAPPGICMYKECDHQRADGKYYCHQHKCSEKGCSNSTSLLIDYCERHNCTYGTCSAPKYSAAGSSYCQRHYIETYK